MFPSIMAPSDLPFEARFEPLNERPPAADAATPFEPLITLLYRPHRAEAAEEEFLDRDDAEAYRLAEFIRRSVTGSPPLSVNVRGVIRPATYDDFAILLRSGSNQIRYERMLRLFDIPYSSQTIRSLFLEAPLNDLYAILQLAVYPYDRSAYAAVLRGPFAHLSDDAVVRILGRFERPFSEAPLKDLPTDNRKYLLATDLYADLVSRVDRVPIPELLRMLWYDYGYRYTLLRDPAHHTYLEYFDYFLALAESTDAASMAEFLDTVRPHLGRYEKLPELSYLPESTNGVQIMTIHKAKGLEFPVVILANTGNVGRREGAGTTPYYLHPEFGLTFNLIPEGNAPGSRDRSNYFYVLGREEREQREYAELKRLLYVGMTRAESHLVISGVHHAGNQKSEEALLNMILGALDNGGDAGSGYRFVREEIGDVSREEYFRAIGGSRPADIASVSPLYEAAPVIHRRVPRHRVSVTELNREHAAFKDDAESKAATQLKAIASDAVIAEYHVEAQFGTLCHHVLQMRIAGVYETPDDIPQRSLRNFRLDALEPEERTLLLKDAWLLADRFLASKTARLMEGALLVETEVPFVLRTEEEGNELMVRGQIDLLVARTDELVVIDFKTDRTIRDGEYAEQLSLYRQAAPDLVPPSVVSGRTSASPWVVRSELYYLRDFQ
jgi:ATP-dependent exoDNAse (exonuclease V) beta subunit